MQSTAGCTNPLCRPNNKTTSLWTFSRKEQQHISTSRSGHRAMPPDGHGIGGGEWTLPITALTQKKVKTIQNIAFGRRRPCRYSRQHLEHNVVKWSHYRAGVAQRVSRGIALLYHDRGTRRGLVASSTPRPHFTPRKDPVPILQEAGWAPGPVWTVGKSRHHRDSIPDRPARSQSLYRLSYPAHKTDD